MDSRSILRGSVLGAALAAFGAAEGAWLADPSYGANGVRALETFPDATQSLVASATDAAGRLVAVGSVQQGSVRDLLVARFLDDGRLDASFGFGGLAQVDTGGAEDGLAVAIQADGRIVVVGGRDGGALVVRLDANGALDAGFAQNGVLRIALLSGSAGRLVDVALDAQQRIVAAGSLAAGGGAQSAAYPFVVRVDAAGRLDPSFDGDGVRVVREVVARAGAIAIDAAQRIVVAGYWDDEYRLAALGELGALDAGFGVGGIARVDVGQPTLATDLLARADGYFVAGINGAALVRFGTSGVVDAAFGANGVAAGPLPLNVWSLAAMADGSIGVAGSCRSGTSDGMMIGAFDARGAFTAVVCESLSSAGAFAEVRSLAVHAGDLHGIALRFESGRTGVAELRYVAQAPRPALSPALAKKCKKAKFARKNPQVCGV